MVGDKLIEYRVILYTRKENFSLLAKLCSYGVTLFNNLSLKTEVYFIFLSFNLEISG